MAVLSPEDRAIAAEVERAAAAVLAELARLDVPSDLAGVALLTATIRMAIVDAKKHGEELSEEEAYLSIAQVCMVGAGAEDEE